jgi:hypothetical protein
MSDSFYYNSTGNFGITPKFKCSGYGLGKMIEGLENPVGVEIGLAEGFTTRFLMESNKNLTLYCIDPYINYIDWNGTNLNERENIYQQFLDNTKVFGDRIKFLRKYSDDAVSNIEDNSLDFVFIDGLHTFEQVTKDMTNYYPKLKDGGIFSGHDFRVIKCINEAVIEFASSKNKTILETECDVWYWYK